jgi:hypothetical protein
MRARAFGGSSSSECHGAAVTSTLHARTHARTHAHVVIHANRGGGGLGAVAHPSGPQNSHTVLIGCGMPSLSSCGHRVVCVPARCAGQ